TLHEALEKISLGMSIMLRNSSASKDFPNLISLIRTHPNDVMLCTDDCHPDELLKGYINQMVKTALDQGYDIFDVLTAAVKTPVKLYDMPVGLLQKGDPADFIVVDNLSSINILATHINGNKVFDINVAALDNASHIDLINRFYENEI